MLFLTDGFQKYRLGKQFHREGSVPQAKDVLHGMFNWNPLTVFGLFSNIFDLKSYMSFLWVYKFSLHLDCRFSMVISSTGAMRFLHHLELLRTVVLCDCSHLSLCFFVTTCTWSSDGQVVTNAAYQTITTPKSQNSQEYVCLLSLHFL
jgi:hypothetical protein